MKNEKANAFGWTLVIIFLILATGYYIISNDFFFRSKFIQTAENIDKGINDIKYNAHTLSCPEKILPEKITIYEAEGWAGSVESLEYRYVILSNWKDGTDLYVDRDPMSPMTPYLNMFGPDCRKGKNEGENINYMYCDGLSYNNSVQQISTDGTIGKTSKEVYSISLELSPIEEEEWAVRGEGDNINRLKIYGNYTIVSSRCIER